MVPHSVITVSLATAILPRLSGQAAERRPAGLARHAGDDAAHRAGRDRARSRCCCPWSPATPPTCIWGYGAGDDSYQNFAPTLALFGIGLVFFTVHYLMLRGFYALERTRTVFFIQCVDRRHQHRRRAAAGPARRPPRRPRRRWCSPTPRRTSSARPSPRWCCARACGGLGTRAAGRGSWCGPLLLAALVSTAAAYAVRLLLGALGADPHLWSRCSGRWRSPRSTWACSCVLARVLRLDEVTDGARHGACGGYRRDDRHEATYHDDERAGGGRRTVTQAATGRATCSPTATAWSTCSPRAGTAGSGAPTTGSSTGTSPLHCIADDDDRAPGLTEAARLSATVLDRRLLRVLDADQRDGCPTSSTSGAPAPPSTSCCR